MAVALDRMGAVAELQVLPCRMRLAGRQVDRDKIEKARLGAPVLPAAGAIALAPEHVGLGHALHMAAAVPIKPVIRPPRRAGPEALPAEAPGLGRLARGVAGLAAQPGLAARDPRDQFELPAQDVAAGRAELAVGAMVRIGAEEGPEPEVCAISRHRLARDRLSLKK